MTTTRDPSAPTTVDTRDRILVAAANVLARRGFAEAKLREIADLAAVRPPAVYYYFSSREELLAEVLHTGQQRVRLHVASALAALPAGTDHETRIAAACAAHLSIQTAMADFARAVSRNIAHAHGPAHEQLHRESEAYHDLWRGLLSAAAADGAIRTDLDLSTARMFVIGALNGSTEWFHGTDDTERLIEQAQALVRHGLRPPRPTRPHRSTKGSP
ncbi:TetR/AcrR family transcriptional regulator [Aeromicrobium alkaliterrae]|uniref:TetR/AcrR family transcriptional regulator n=1 Tax=Aeromicrobium alkaliterrae TaxID=302168 RepID=A0ABP4WAF8_9ACTN